MLRWRILLTIVLAGLSFCSLAEPVVAMASGAISQSYSANSNIAPGTVLSLAPTGNSLVQPAANVGQGVPLVGVAVSQPVLELSGGGTGTIQVAVGGVAPALVSDINGPVQAGDHLAASPIAGVGMKASGAGQVVGVAQADLGSVPTTSQNFTDRSGKSHSVKIGLVPVAVGVEYYTGGGSGAVSAFVPQFLQDMADAIAGKPVSPARVLVAFAVLILGTFIVLFMLNSAIRNGIISIGRNPLAGAALRKGLLDVVLTAFGILLVSGVLTYVILSV